MQDIRLIATDLDGTIIGDVNDLRLYTAFRDRIDELRKQHHAVWAICTGRSLGAFRDFFTPMRMMGAVPDFVIVRHAYIYGLTSFGYMPHLFWNLKIRYLLWLGIADTRRVVDECHEMVSHFQTGVATVKRGRDRLWLRFDSEEAALAVAEMLKEKVRPYHHLQVFRYPMEVDVRPVPYTKGLAVSELAQHLDIGRDQILAIGNGHTDISMLDGRTAKLTGCPRSSKAEVIEVVHKSGGHIASQDSLAGVMEILNAYATGAVRSDLPPDWTNLSQDSHSQSSLSVINRSKSRLGIHMWLAALMAYTVVTVFAINLHFPGSYWIAKPYWLLVALIKKLVLWLIG